MSIANARLSRGAARARARGRGRGRTATRGDAGETARRSRAGDVRARARDDGDDATVTVDDAAVVDDRSGGVDVQDAMASFSEAAGGAMDKISRWGDVLASRTVDLDVVEIVEEDVVEETKRGGFGLPALPSFGTKREVEEEVDEEAPRAKGLADFFGSAKEKAVRERAEPVAKKSGFTFKSEKKVTPANAEKAPAKKSSFSFGKKAAAEEPVEEAPAKPSNGFAAILQKSSRRIDDTRAVLAKDMEEGVAAQQRLRASREAGGAAVAAFTGGQVGEGTWTFTQIIDEEDGSKGKKLPPLKIKRGETKIIGRSKGPGVDLVVPLNCVSSVHAELITEGNKLYIQDLGSTNGTYVEGFEVRKDKKFRIFNGAEVRFGAENFNGEQYAKYKATLAGAKELEKDSEYGQLNYFMEYLGGPRTVVNFFFINAIFQATFFILIKLNAD